MQAVPWRDNLLGFLPPLPALLADVPCKCRPLALPPRASALVATSLERAESRARHVEVEQQVLFLHAHVLRGRHHLQHFVPRFRQVECVKPAPLPFSHAPHSALAFRSPNRAACGRHGARADGRQQEVLSCTAWPQLPQRAARSMRGMAGFVFSKNPGLRVTRVCCRRAARMMDLLSRQRVSAWRRRWRGRPRGAGHESPGQQRRAFVVLGSAFGTRGAGT